MLGVLWCGLSAVPAAAQFNTAAQGAREGALGGCLLPEPGERRVEAAWRQAFATAGMAERTLRVQVPLGAMGTLWTAYSAFGGEAYHEQQAAVAYTLRVARWLQVGVGGRWLQAATADAHYDSRQWLAAGAAALAQWGRTGAVAVAESHPWDEAHPLALCLQLHHAGTEGLLTVAQAELQERWRARMGVEYTMDEWLSLRGGLATGPLALTFGAGVRQRWLAVDLAVALHRWLGPSPQIALRLWF